MKGDFSKIKFPTKKNYRRVLWQQGRVLTDADLNAWGNIQEYRESIYLTDIIGKTGVPEDPGVRLELNKSFRISPFETSDGHVSYTIGEGRIYVDGILVENHSEVDARLQPYLPLLSIEDLPSDIIPKDEGTYLAYLDVYDRHITNLEDPDIQESALGGADTTTRSQTVWGVKIHKLEKGDFLDENSWAPWKFLDNKVSDIRIGKNNNGNFLEVFALSKPDQTIPIGEGVRMSRRQISSNPTTWEGTWERAPETDQEKKIEIAINKQGLLEMFGIDLLNHSIRISTREENSRWGEWRQGPSFPPGNELKSQKIALGQNNDRILTLFAIHEEEGRIYFSKQKDNMKEWEAWEPIFDKQFVDLTVITNPNDLLIEIYAIERTDRQIWYTKQESANSKTWQDWKTLNPQINSDEPAKFASVAAGINRNNQPVIFAVDDFNSRSIWYTFSQGNGWKKVGENIQAQMAISGISVQKNERKENRLELFAIFANSLGFASGDIRNISEDEDGSWNSEWKTIKGFKARMISTAIDNLSVLNIFAIDETGSVYQSYDESSESLNCESSIKSWYSKVKPSSLKIKARTKPDDSISDNCMLPERAGYRRLENQLYRIEIHDTKSNDKKATFKYSRNNGAVCSKILNISDTKISLESLGKDSLLGFENNQLVEFTDDRLELWGLPGFLAKIKEVNSTDQSLTYEKDSLVPVGAIVSNETFPQQFNPKLRGWDSHEAIEVKIPDENGGFLAIEDGLEIKFDSINGTTARTGDFWTIKARTLRADIEWPKNEDGFPELVDVDGIEHHYVKLAFLKFSAGKLDVILDCRESFPSLNRLENLPEPKPITTKPDLMLTNGMAFRYIDKIGGIPINNGAKIFEVNQNIPGKWYIVNAGPTESITFELTGATFDVIDRIFVGDPPPYLQKLSSIEIAPGCSHILRVGATSQGDHLGKDYNSDHFFKGGCFKVIAGPIDKPHPDNASKIHKLTFASDQNKYSLELVAKTEQVQICPDNSLFPNGITYNSTFFQGKDLKNGQVISILNDLPPGPAIMLKTNERLQVTFRNETGSIQGVYFQGTPSRDFMAVIEPGGSKTIEMRFPNPGVFLYYGIGNAFVGIGNRINDGMYGVIVVDDNPDSPTRGSEYCIFFSDFNMPQ